MFDRGRIAAQDSQVTTILFGEKKGEFNNKVRNNRTLLFSKHMTDLITHTY